MVTIYLRTWCHLPTHLWASILLFFQALQTHGMFHNCWIHRVLPCLYSFCTQCSLFVLPQMLSCTLNPVPIYPSRKMQLNPEILGQVVPSLKAPMIKWSLLLYKPQHFTAYLLPHLRHFTVSVGFSVFLIRLRSLRICLNMSKIMDLWAQLPSKKILVLFQHSPSERTKAKALVEKETRCHSWRFPFTHPLSLHHKILSILSPASSFLLYPPKSKQQLSLTQTKAITH